VLRKKHAFGGGRGNSKAPCEQEIDKQKQIFKEHLVTRPEESTAFRLITPALSLGCASANSRGKTAE
jgi:hypothetical protein